VLTYLVRVSPYTEEQIRFQNNQFDSPNRQINSIDEILAILSSSNDNRELIPEYFTTVEFLLNANYIDFGYRISDRIMINDIEQQDKFFNSIGQFIYYNRLLLNYKSDYNELNTTAFEEELKINLWIDLIFGYKQWDQKPKKDKLNLFGKYCYRQFINFDKILEKYKDKGYDDKKIISKIDSKKGRIINFGQCPEVLFNSEHEKNILYLPREIKEQVDDMDLFQTSQTTININNYQKSVNKKFNIITFWISKNKIKSYIYFLVYEEKSKSDKNIMDQYYIFVYEDASAKKEIPDFTIRINNIVLFNIKTKFHNNLNKMSNNNLALNKSYCEKSECYLDSKTMNKSIIS
jgi:hypothetical protein